MYTINSAAGKKIERKLLITVAVWGEDNARKHCILGTRTEDSSIEFNADVSTSTDILGINYTDLNKTQPQQSFDPAYILGGDNLMAYLNEAALKNDINAFNNSFNVYVVAAYMKDGDSSAKYRTVKHSNCSIIPASLGGSDFLTMPFVVYFSNEITMGSVASYDKENLLKLEAETTPSFTADT